MHSEYFAGIAKYDYIGLAHSIDEKSAVGFAAIRFGVDDIPNTTQLIDNEGNIDYDRITLFTAADYGFLFSYGRKLGIEGLSRSEEHTSELQSRPHLVCSLLLE